jgi:TatD DNase family protein
MIDSHTHLDHTPGDVAEIVARARDAGVTRILTIGTDPGSCREALAAADAHEEVFAAVGRHPNSVTGFDDGGAGELHELAGHPRCRAIGETGLDFYRDSASREDQKRAFTAQLELAESLGKPLVIHSRAAETETLKMLEGTTGTVILHCFSMPGHLDDCVKRGYFISFAGNVTYPKATDLQDAAARVPDELLLVETDAPFLAPQPVRGKPNAPSNVVHTARKLAELRGVSYEDLEQLVEDNAARTFGW